MPVTISNVRLRIRVKREAQAGYTQQPAKTPRSNLQYLDSPALTKPEPIDEEAISESLQMERRADERPSAQEVADRIYDMIMQEARINAERGAR